MNEIKVSKFIVVLLTSIIILFGLKTTLADNIAPEVQTQVNKRTDLFEKSIDDLPVVEKRLEDSKHEAIKSLGDGSSQPQGLSSITKKTKGELEVESNKLNAIREHDLNAKGREEMIKNNIINELYPDYTRPLNKQYMEDARIIAAGQSKLLDNLLGKLKELGVDCKTIKGDKRVEPEYFLKVKATEHKDTIYNQTFCEELRNKYFCNDTLTMKCVNKGSGNFQAQTIRLAYNEMPDHWWGALYGTTPVYGLFSRSRGFVDFLGHSKFQSENHNQIREEAKSIIMKKTGAKNIEFPEQQIFVVQRREIFYHLDENGNNGPINGRWPAVDADGTIRFFYRVAQEENCATWSEEWSEECRLQ